MRRQFDTAMNCVLKELEDDPPGSYEEAPSPLCLPGSNKVGGEEHDDFFDDPLVSNSGIGRASYRFFVVSWRAGTSSGCRGGQEGRQRNCLRERCPTVHANKCGI